MAIINSILPVFLIIGIGYFLKRKSVISENTDMFLNNLAYYFVLPCMIFASIYKLPFRDIFYIESIIGIYIATFSVFLFSLALSFFLKHKKRGAFVTSSFRSNVAYIGFPIALSLFGQEGLAKISVITGFMGAFIVTVSVIYLSLIDRKEGKKENPVMILVKDPLILTCIAALVFSYYKIWMPEFIFNTIDMVSYMGAPLMLLAVGSGLKIESIKKDRVLLGVISFIKLLILPLVAVLIFKYVVIIGDKVNFAIAVLTVTCPTALSSYILVKKYHSDHELCASSITITTILSMFTIFGWVFFMIS